ncbi:MAG: VacJ family lipoprotein [Pseudomonadales bacterium]|nr:VacJ family lipoprotein [Pseudomonadales bacterium]
MQYGLRRKTWVLTQFAVILSTTMLLASVSHAQNPTADPLQAFNRRVQAFNDVFDRYLLKPATQVYVAVIPGFARRGVNNAFNNAAYPTVFINQFLQGRFSDGASDTARFVVNTTIGIGGLFDVARRIGLPAHNEDFGQTFASWGAGSGPYLVVPFWGPATIRDGLGDIADFYAYLPTYIDHVPTRNSVTGFSFIDLRAEVLQQEQLVSGDRYLFIRDVYLQRRQFLNNNGAEVDDPFLDD